MSKDQTELDMDAVFAATKVALRRAALADPAAVHELALDLSEIAFFERERDMAKAARIRAGRTIVKLRKRFNNNIPNLPAPKNIDGEYFTPTEIDGKRQYLINEVGIWILFLDYMNDPDHEFKNGTPPLWIKQLKQWLYEFRDNCPAKPPALPERIEAVLQLRE